MHKVHPQLLMATGYTYNEIQEQWVSPLNQLTVSTEDLSLDSVITQWAAIKFGSFQQIITF